MSKTKNCYDAGRFEVRALKIRYEFSQVRSGSSSVHAPFLKRFFR